MGKLFTLVVIATGLAYQFSWFLQLTSSGIAYLTELEQKISAVGVGSPYSQLYTVS